MKKIYNYYPFILGSTGTYIIINTLVYIIFE